MDLSWAEIVEGMAERGQLARTPMADTTFDRYTAEARLCDDAGLVSDQRVTPGSPGTLLDPDLTYRQLLNNLRGHTGLPPYEGQPFRCTGSAHLAGEHFRCTNPRHQVQAPGTNTGHGHVWPRPDGMKARCGGPAICTQCALDAGRLQGRTDG